FLLAFREIAPEWRQNAQASVPLAVVLITQILIYLFRAVVWIGEAPVLVAAARCRPDYLLPDDRGHLRGFFHADTGAWSRGIPILACVHAGQPDVVAEPAGTV